jgi:exodeoxyribonuclease VII small subunit
MAKTDNFSYEKNLKELESILAELEKGEIAIDDLFIKAKKASELIQKLKEKLYLTEKELIDLLDNEKNNNEK